MRASAPLGLVTGVFDRLDMEPQKKRKRLTLDEKAAIIRTVTSGQKKCDVAAAHGIPASTLSTILKGKDDILRASSSGNLAHKNTEDYPPWQGVRGPFRMVYGCAGKEHSRQW